jgi:hypothetical protein
VQTHMEIGTGVPIEKENLLEFHLLYSGPLHSAGYEYQRKEKHDIRKVFHSQLRHLWETNPNLRERAVGRGEALRPSGIKPEQLENQDFQNGAFSMAQNWNQYGFCFLPLVTKKVCLRCSLDILFLRAEERNYVLQGGDIDGRIKILFDALRIAREASELPPGAKPDLDENPLFCLLENDELISQVNINTDRLLNLPEKKVIDKSDVYLQITVRLNPTVVAADSWVFE